MCFIVEFITGSAFLCIGKLLTVLEYPINISLIFAKVVCFCCFFYFVFLFFLFRGGGLLSAIINYQWKVEESRTDRFYFHIWCTQRMSLFLYVFFFFYFAGIKTVKTIYLCPSELLQQRRIVYYCKYNFTWYR